MAKEAVKQTDAQQELEALKSRVDAILESNGFSGAKCAGEVKAAVGEYLGVEFTEAN